GGGAGVKLLPLGMLLPGEEGVIRDVGERGSLHSRLTALGLLPGQRIRVVQNQFCGPLIIAVGDGRLALGRGLAYKILVEQVGR
ncbi:FeoA family protein, partial [Thermodesulfitimonas sp.]